MKLPEEEQKAYDHYKDDLHYQASMFESSFGDGYGVGHKQGEAIGEVRGEAKATRQMVFNMAKKELSIETIAGITGLTEKEI